MVMDGLPRPARAPPPPVHDDLDGDATQCPNHPYRTNAAASTGGICALCLQEKLGKLVSSSSSFRSDPSAAANAASAVLVAPATSSREEDQAFTNHTSTARRARIPFLLPHKKKKPVSDYSPSNLVLKRSKSAALPRRRTVGTDDYSTPNRKRGGFWSFLYHSKTKSDKTSSSGSSSVKPEHQTTSLPSRKHQRSDYVVVVDESLENNNKNNAMSFGGKVSRSRSVGCGSRSFSGDFFERISGLGDCTLRRVESQREGRRCSTGDAIQEKIRCAGIFGGFMMTSSSSSYWVSAAGEEQQHVNGKESSAQGRRGSWGWALASPMRALTKPSPSSSSTRDLKSDASKSNDTPTPNLSAIPSLLTARG